MPPLTNQRKFETLRLELDSLSKLAAEAIITVIRYWKQTEALRDKMSV